MKKILFALWNYLIFAAIGVAVFFLFRFYFEISPAGLARLENYQLLITTIFIIDIFVRLFIFKIEYVKSTDFFIDVISCLDIINVLKVFKIFRFMRVLRFIRLLRILKFTRVLENIDNKTRTIFNYIGLISLLFFIFSGMFISNHIRTKVVLNERNNFAALLKIAVDQSVVDGELDNSKLISSLGTIKNLLNIEMIKADKIYQYNTLDMASEEYAKFVTDNYFPADLLTVEYNELKATIVIKNLNFLAQRIEYYSLMFALFYYIVLFAVFYFANSGNEEN